MVDESLEIARLTEKDPGRNAKVDMYNPEHMVTDNGAENLLQYLSNSQLLVYTLTLKNRAIIVRFHGGGHALMHLFEMNFHEPKISQHESGDIRY